MRIIEWALRVAAPGAVVIGMTAATAAGIRPEVRPLIQSDRAASTQGDLRRDPATCSTEAPAALPEAWREFHRNGEATLARNRALRCDPLPPGDCQDCIRRLNGEGLTRGRVGGGDVDGGPATAAPIF